MYSDILVLRFSHKRDNENYKRWTFWEKYLFNVFYTRQNHRKQYPHQIGGIQNYQICGIQEGIR